MTDREARRRTLEEKLAFSMQLLTGHGAGTAEFEAQLLRHCELLQSLEALDTKGQDNE